MIARTIQPRSKDWVLTGPDMPGPRTAPGTAPPRALPPPQGGPAPRVLGQEDEREDHGPERRTEQEYRGQGRGHPGHAQQAGFEDGTRMAPRAHQEQGERDRGTREQADDPGRAPVPF